jgi:hypothetical protein
MQTPEVALAAIHHLQRHVPEEVQCHFGIEADGSFRLDAVWITATKR